MKVVEQLRYTIYFEKLSVKILEINLQLLLYFIVNYYSLDEKDFEVF